MRGPARTALAAYDLPAVESDGVAPRAQHDFPGGRRRGRPVCAGGPAAGQPERADGPVEDDVAPGSAAQQPGGPRAGADPLGGRADRDRGSLPPCRRREAACCTAGSKAGSWTARSPSGTCTRWARSPPACSRTGRRWPAFAGFERGPVNTVTELGLTPPDGPSPAAAEHAAELVAQVHSVSGAGVVRDVRARPAGPGVAGPRTGGLRPRDWFSEGVNCLLGVD
jgi:hypothetical protein